MINFGLPSGSIRSVWVGSEPTHCHPKLLWIIYMMLSCFVAVNLVALVLINKYVLTKNLSGTEYLIIPCLAGVKASPLIQGLMILFMLVVCSACTKTSKAHVLLPKDVIIMVFIFLMKSQAACCKMQIYEKPSSLLPLYKLGWY